MKHLSIVALSLFMLFYPSIFAQEDKFSDTLISEGFVPLTSLPDFSSGGDPIVVNPELILVAVSRSDFIRYYNYSIYIPRDSINRNLAFDGQSNEPFNLNFTLTEITNQGKVSYGNRAVAFDEFAIYKRATISSQMSFGNHRLRLEITSPDIGEQVFSWDAEIVPTFSDKLGNWFGNQLFSLSLSLLLVLGSLLGVISGIFERRLKKRVGKQVAVVQNLESESQSDVAGPNGIAFDKFVERQLEVATERIRINMIQAEGRALRLFTIGNAFIILSVLAPVGSIILYIWLNPLNHLTLNEDAREALTYFSSISVTVPSIELSATRDWHILLLGISFGLLFLAASRAILGLESQMRTLYFQLSERVNYYENAVLAWRIAERGKEESYNLKPDAVLAGIINALTEITTMNSWGSVKDASVKINAPDGREAKAETSLSDFVNEFRELVNSKSS